MREIICLFAPCEPCGIERMQISDHPVVTEGIQNVKNFLNEWDPSKASNPANFHPGVVGSIAKAAVEHRGDDSILDDEIAVAAIMKTMIGVCVVKN